MPGIEVRHLRAFVAVAEELHFGRAAQRLHMAQPPLSQLIRSMEKSLDTQLLTRTTRSVALTSVGQEVLERARHVLRSFDELVDDVRRTERGEIGRVRLGFTDVVAVSMVPLLAQSFQAAHPNVELDLRGSYYSYEEVELLLAGDLDAGIIHGPVGHPQLATLQIGADDLVVALSASHRLADRTEIDLIELADEPFITYLKGRGSSIREAIITDCASAGFRPRFVREVDESMAIVALAASGVGVAILPSSLTIFSPLGGIYRPLKGARHSLAVTLAWRRDDDSPALALLLEAARQLTAERA